MRRAAALHGGACGEGRPPSFPASHQAACAGPWAESEPPRSPSPSQGMRAPHTGPPRSQCGASRRAGRFLQRGLRCALSTLASPGLPPCRKLRCCHWPRGREAHARVWRELSGGHATPRRVPPLSRARSRHRASEIQSLTRPAPPTRGASWSGASRSTAPGRPHSRWLSGGPPERGRPARRHRSRLLAPARPTLQRKPPCEFSFQPSTLLKRTRHVP